MVRWRDGATTARQNEGRSRPRSDGSTDEKKGEGLTLPLPLGRRVFILSCDSVLGRFFSSTERPSLLLPISALMLSSLHQRATPPFFSGSLVLPLLSLFPFLSSRLRICAGFVSTRLWFYGRRFVTCGVGGGRADERLFARSFLEDCWRSTTTKSKGERRR